MRRAAAWGAAPLLALLAMLLAWAHPGAHAGAHAGEPLLVDLAEGRWTRNGVEPSGAPEVRRAGERALVALPCEALGVRWATTFETGVGGMARLQLDWAGGRDGLLFELVVDGQRLAPARDAWRPSPRDLRSDLGSLWLGPGGHLFEIVAREQPASTAAVHLSALEIAWLP